MTYQLTIKYPKLEERIDEKDSVTNKKETMTEISKEEILELYQEFTRAGYTVKVDFKTENAFDEFDVFQMAHVLETNGIDYKATLKFLDKTNKGDYDTIAIIAQIIERYGFDYTVSSKLPVNEKSEINFDKEDTWFGPSAQYTLTPSIRVKSASEFKSLAEELNQHATVTGIIKTKQTDDQILYLCLDHYPAGTEVTLTLKLA